MREHQEMRDGPMSVAPPRWWLAGAARMMNRHRRLLALLILLTLGGCAAAGAVNPNYDPYLSRGRGHFPDF